MGLSMTSAQSLTQANKYYRELNYQRAIPAYESIIKKSGKAEAIFNLADCYKKVGDMQKAEYWYTQAVLQSEATPEMFILLAQAQLANGNIHAARRNVEKFLSHSPRDLRGNNLLKACDEAVQEELKNAGALYKVQAVEAINTENDDFSPVFYKNGLIYCTEKDSSGAVLRRSAWTGREFVSQYFTVVRLLDEDKMDFRFGAPTPFADELRTKWHDGPLTIDADGKMLFATRNHVDKNKVAYSSNGIVHTKIVSAQNLGGVWSKIDNVSFNNKEYSVMHPALTPDGGKMYFASDMPGGFGGMDLYLAYREGNGSWSAPVNLGPGINTEGDEVFPYVDQNGLLYFASDGHVGMGGLDIYYSRAVRGVWDPVTNVGAPLNSIKDDFGFVIDSTRKYGFISSNRDGGKGLTDIYLFTRMSVDAEVLVFRGDDGIGLDSVEVTSDCFPKQTFYTNVEGKLYIELPMDRTCNFTLSSPNFEKKNITISTKDYAVGAKISQQVPIEANKDLKFVVKGTAVNKEDNSPLAGAEITLLSSCTKSSQMAIADHEGNFSFELEPACCYVARASKDGYFISASQFCTKGLYKSDSLLTTIEMPALMTVNGKSILDTNAVFLVENIYHQYDKADINHLTSSGLLTLLNLLQNNPNLSIEIRSHTDSRGSAEYNQRLSERRAKAIADYLIGQGIDSNRLTYIGVGETEILNGCYDGLSCTEEEHAINRRTEFRATKVN